MWWPVCWWLWLRVLRWGRGENWKGANGHWVSPWTAVLSAASALPGYKLVLKVGWTHDCGLGEAGTAQEPGHLRLAFREPRREWACRFSLGLWTGEARGGCMSSQDVASKFSTSCLVWERPCVPQCSLVVTPFWTFLLLWKVGNEARDRGNMK